MKVSIRRAKKPKARKTRKAKKAKKKFKMPKVKLPKVKLPKVKMPKLKLPKFKKMSEAHFAVMILAVVAIISVAGLVMYTPLNETTTGAVTAYGSMCDNRCAYDEIPVGFTYLGSGNVECICKKTG